MKNTTSNPAIKDNFLIKSINQRVYEAQDKFGEILPLKIIDKYYNLFSEGSLENYLEEYDHNSNLIKKTFFDLENIICKINTYSYIDNNLIEEKKEEKKEEDQLNLEFLNKYIYEYNTLKKIKSITIFDENDQIEEKLIYKYTNEDIIDEINLYDNEGVFYEKIKYIYDENSILINKKYYSKEGFYKYSDYYKYDNQILVNENLAIDIFIEKENYKNNFYFDKNGNVIKYSFIKGKEKFIIHQSFDEKGYLIICINVYEHNEQYYPRYINDEITYAYNIDNNGNWINKIHYRNEIPFAITKREIEYYNNNYKQVNEGELVC